MADPAHRQKPIEVVSPVARAELQVMWVGAIAGAALPVDDVFAPSPTSLEEFIPTLVPILVIQHIVTRGCHITSRVLEMPRFGGLTISLHFFLASYCLSFS